MYIRYCVTGIDPRMNVTEVVRAAKPPTVGDFLDAYMEMSGEDQGRIMALLETVDAVDAEYNEWEDEGPNTEGDTSTEEAKDERIPEHV